MSQAGILEVAKVGDSAPDTLLVLVTCVTEFSEYTYTRSRKEPKYTKMYYSIQRYTRVYSDILWHTRVYSDILWYTRVYRDILENTSTRRL